MSKTDTEREHYTTDPRRRRIANRKRIPIGKAAARFVRFRDKNYYLSKSLPT
jgi:hypothetical protein